MKLLTSLISATLAIGLASAQPFLSSADDAGLQVRSAHHAAMGLDDGPWGLQRREALVLQAMLERRSPVGSRPSSPAPSKPKVNWAGDPYKDDPAKKAELEGHVCNALERAGCAEGTIQGGLHPSRYDPKDHLQVKQDDGKKFHVYPDGTAAKQGKKGKIIPFRRRDLAGYSVYH